VAVAGQQHSGREAAHAAAQHDDVRHSPETPLVERADRTPAV
jgi:hypothetical protein